MSRIKDLAAALGSAGVLGAAGYGDLKMSKREAKEKADEKIEEMKRRQEPSGSDSDTKAVPKAHKAGGKVSSASKRADGCAIRGKTKGKMV